MWNVAIPGTTSLPDTRPTTHFLLRSGAIETIFRNRLPGGWMVELQEGQPRKGPDATLWLTTPGGERTGMLVEVKTGLHPRDVLYLADQLKRSGAGPKLVVAPFITPRTREALIQQEISFVDMTGNVRVALDRPALFIQDRGLESDPWRQERSIRSLKGPTAGRVVRALCDFRPPYGVRELAQRSRTSQASVSRVISFLEPEDLITRDDRGRVMTVDWANLIRRWSQDYSFMTSNTVSTWLEPRGLNSLLEKLRDLRGAEWAYALTGSIAANEIAAYAPARLATLYTQNTRALAEELGLRPVESGTNVLMAEPFDPVVFDRTWQRDGLVYSALSQVAADLLTGPGRAPAEAEELLRWMRENEDAWRS